MVPAGTRDVPAGEPLAVLVYEEKDVEAFNHLPRYHHKGSEGEGGAAAAAAEGEEGEMAVDGVTLLKFLHKLVRNGSIQDKGEKREGGRREGGRKGRRMGGKRFAIYSICRFAFMFQLWFTK